MVKEKSMKKFIVCIDSDGCAMDTMDVKHLNYFGPALVDVYGIQQKAAFLAEWNRINLYSLTRGINRFLGLVMGLEYAQAHGEAVGDFTALKKWTETTDSLSNDSLKKAMQAQPDKSFEQALAWSLKVNQGIEKELSGNDRPFEGVKEALKVISQHANIGLVSSANKEALDSEWTRHGLIDEVDFVYGQEIGNKGLALKEIIKKGFEPTHVLMVGDSPGDEVATREAGTYFFPILFGQETQSWEELVQVALPKFLSGDYAEINQTMKEKFYHHLAK